MSLALNLGLGLWIGMGLMCSGLLAVCSHDGSFKQFQLPMEQSIAFGICIFLFFPLVVLGTVVLGLYKGIPFLGRGFTGLYRTFVPAKVKLPKAQVLKKEAV